MLEYAIRTNIGDSSINEDFAGSITNKNGLQAFALADGLGGHGGGDIAATLAVEAVLDTVSETNDATVSLLEKCFVQAQNLVLENRSNSGRRREMKTTLTVMLADKDKILWGHIGDSRLYHCRKGKIKSCTMDHSVAQLLVNSHKISRDEQCHHEDRSILLRAVGTPWSTTTGFQTDCKGIRPRKGDTFVLCSDGAWEWVVDQRLAQIACSKSDVDIIAENLLNEALLAGKGSAMDNGTVLVARVT